MVSAASPAIAPVQPSLSVISLPWSAEFELLRSCCADQHAVAERLARSFRWDLVVSLAEHHGVIPRIYEYLSRSLMVPEPAVSALRRLHDDNLRRTLWLTRELLRVLEHLRECGIAVMPYKGPVLAEMLYGNVTARSFSDLDLLVQRNDVMRAKAALRELGYGSSLQLSERQTRAYLDSGYEYTFDGSHGTNLVELQWQIVPRFYAVDFAMERVFERAIPVRVGGIVVETPSKEDLLLILCVHAAKHVWARLGWLCDIRQLVRSTEIDWSFIDTESRRIGIQRIIQVTFFLIARLFGEEKWQVARASVDPAIKLVGDKALRVISGDADLDPESFAYFRLMLWTREKMQDQLKVGWRLLTTAGIGEWKAVRLPDSLLPLYRAVRLGRVTRRALS